MKICAVKTLLLLKSIPKLGCKTINQLINKLGNITEIFNCTHAQLAELGLQHVQIQKILNPDWSYSERQLAIAKAKGVEIISIYDKAYPRSLKQIYDPPVVLYVQGNKKILTAELFAIVGSRTTTIYGQQMTSLFSKELQAYGYILVSGFAVGIDIIAHLAAIKQQRPTVVVLGTSLDWIYPSCHKKYVDKIIEYGGVLISENGFTTIPSPSCFPNRNRIITGLSRGVLIVEAARKSGSLITARCAMEQSREVFAIPGNINNPQALGCLDLIANGAKLVISAQDIIEELSGIKAVYTYQNSSNQSDASPQPLAPLANSVSAAGQLLLTAISGGAAEFDQIVQSCHLTAQEAASLLIQLEIQGLVTCVNGSYVRLTD